MPVCLGQRGKGSGEFYSMARVREGEGGRGVGNSIPWPGTERGKEGGVWGILYHCPGQRGGKEGGSGEFYSIAWGRGGGMGNSIPLPGGRRGMGNSSPLPGTEGGGGILFHCLGQRGRRENSVLLLGDREGEGGEFYSIAWDREGEGGRGMGNSIPLPGTERREGKGEFHGFWYGIVVGTDKKVYRQKSPSVTSPSLLPPPPPPPPPPHSPTFSSVLSFSHLFTFSLSLSCLWIFINGTDGSSSLCLRQGPAFFFLLQGLTVKSIFSNPLCDKNTTCYARYSERPCCFVWQRPLTPLCLGSPCYPFLLLVLRRRKRERKILPSSPKK